MAHVYSIAMLLETTVAITFYFVSGVHEVGTCTVDIYSGMGDFQPNANVSKDFKTEYNIL